MQRILQTIRLYLSKSTFAKHIVAVSGSTLIVQFISLAVAPINTRLYEPSDYGLLAVFAACFGVLSIIATMRYEGAIPIAENDAEGVNLLVLCFVICGFVTIVVSLFSLFAGNYISQLLTSDNRFSVYIWYLPVGVFALAIFNILTAWSVRKHAFSKLSNVRIIQSILGSGCTISMGFLKFGVLGLIAGSLVSSLVGLRTLLKIAVHDFQQQASQVNWRSLVRTAKLYYRFPLLNTWGQLLTSVSTQLPIFVLTSGFGATYTGYFSLCQRILLLPTLLISGAIAPVFFSRAKQAKQDGSLTALTERMLYSIAGINAVFVMFVAFFGESLFEVVFGDKWSRAGVYATALAPWLLLNFLVTPLATLPLVFERQATDLIFHISLLLVRALSLGVGIYFGSDLLAMMLFGWCSAAFMLIYMNWLVSLVKIPLSPLLLRVGREILIASVLLGACRFVLWWSNNNFLLTGFVLIPVFAFFIKRTLEQVKGI